MAEPNDAKPKPFAKKGKSKKSQGERFIETARLLQTDESGNTFEKAFEALVVSKNRDNRNAS